ncbi:hypothetical protein A9Z06_20060 [Rhizobium sp. YK2]|jgi:DNA-binding transcriptional LysR family regulator|nr:hypothetical protein A9Z06_20060 [Rhizobium sp. YK2]
MRRAGRAACRPARSGSPARHISRLIFAFQGRYPNIGGDLSLTDERVDLAREGVDIAHHRSLSGMRMRI